MENVSQKILRKYATKLQIIEKDVELTEDEKQKLYKKIQKKVMKLQARFENKSSFKGFLYDFSKTIAKDEAHNKALGIASLLPIVGGVISLVGCFLGITSPDIAYIASMTIGVGAALRTNSYVNKKDEDGKSIIDEKEKKNKINSESLDKMFTGLKYNLNLLIKQKEVEMER